MYTLNNIIQDSEQPNIEDVWDEMVRESEEIQTSQAADNSAAANRLTDAEEKQAEKSAPEKRLTETDQSMDEPEFTATRIETDSTPSRKPVENGVSLVPCVLYLLFHFPKYIIFHYYTPTT